MPLLRSINRSYGPISVIHFDSHLDTWKPKVFGGSPSKVASINHGTYFYHAAQEGLLANDTNIHAGIRTTLSGPSDYENDGYCGFEIVEAREIDTIGVTGIIKKIKDRVGTTQPVYLSLDIDTLDPACKLRMILDSSCSTLMCQSSRTRNGNARDWRLVHSRAPHDHSWS